MNQYPTIKDECKDMSTQMPIHKPYNGKGVWQVCHWAYILPQATAHHLRSSSQANSPIYGCGDDQPILLPPALVQKNVDS